MRARTMFVVVVLVVGGLSATAMPADATFHLMKVREVYAGSITDVNSEYVELQMYSAGQQFVSGHNVRFYDATGNVTQDCRMPNHVAVGNNQSTILVATTAAQTQFALTPDFVIQPGLSGSGGAACFEGIDCVSWGSFTGSLPSPAGTPFSGGIQAGQSIDRFVSGGTNAGGLDDADDTNNSNNDFEQEGPSPAPNSIASTAQACATGGGGGGGGQGDPNVSVENLKAKTPGSKAVISGRIDPPDPGAKVKVTLFTKGSPFEKAGKKKDTLDAESRFKVRIGVPGDPSRCKVTIAYGGNVEATKKFRC